MSESNSDLKSKIVDLEKIAKDFANSLRYNPELIQDLERVAELVAAIEVRLLQAYNAGLAKKPVVAIIDMGKPVEPGTEAKLN